MEKNVHKDFIQDVEKLKNLTKNRLKDLFG